MKSHAFALVFLSLSLASIASQAQAQNAQAQSAQDQARREMRAGNILRSDEIERRIVPLMPDAQYIGFAYDPTAMAYRLKFIRDGRVMFIDVDARTGKILRRSQ